MAGLHGHVVLVDFWAYSCINCLRTLPFLIRWQHDYKDRGLVVVGVHAPEFKFEHDPKNVQSAITSFGINYPVAQDNDLLTWNAFHNDYWPEEYLIDRSGKIVYVHVGEGNYDETENAIRRVLDAGPAVGPEKGADLSKIGSPEIYFGLDRVKRWQAPSGPGPAPISTLAPADLKPNQFALVGSWSLSGERATLAKGGGEIQLHCHAGKVFMVANSTAPVTLSITVDGKATAPRDRAREPALHPVRRHRLSRSHFGHHRPPGRPFRFHLHLRLGRAVNCALAPSDARFLRSGAQGHNRPLGSGARKHAPILLAMPTIGDTP